MAHVIVTVSLVQKPVAAGEILGVAHVSRYVALAMSESVMSDLVAMALMVMLSDVTEIAELYVGLLAVGSVPSIV